MLIFIPTIMFSQNRSRTDEDAVITINISKISRTIGKAVKFVQDEYNQYKQETEENLQPETKAVIDSLKSQLKYELQYTRDAMHQGYRQGLMGEDYTPPYKHKYRKD